jgi:ArsR family metal-binding transcriptional regulator
MLLKSYQKEIFRPECNSAFESLHCIAHLDQDISGVLPFLNAELGGFDYVKEPPAVIFKSQGRLIAVHGDKIAINALKDEAQADKILKWLVGEINSAWQNRHRIEPCFEGVPKPNVVDLLKCLPQTNCRDCNCPTCLVFACRLAEGVKGPHDCPHLDDGGHQKLNGMMAGYKFAD